VRACVGICKGSTDRVVIAEHEGEPEDLASVERVRIEDGYIHLPFSEVVCLD
jgi:hypothetical protein